MTGVPLAAIVVILDKFTVDGSVNTAYSQLSVSSMNATDLILFPLGFKVG